MRRCTKCTLCEYTPNISFDENGVCSYCAATKPLTHLGEEALLKVLDKHRRTDGKHECVVGLSGGRDSTYTMLKLVKDYGMKVLAVNYDNPFKDPQAGRNVENATRILGVDLVRFTLPNKLHERTFRNGFLTWLRKPLPGMIPMMCVACKLMYKNIMAAANRYDVHCIVTGVNSLEMTSFKNAMLDLPPDAGQEQHFSASTMKPILREVARNPRYLRAWRTMLVGFLYGNGEAPGSKLFGRKLDRIELFDYIPWEEDDVLSRIQNEVEWDYPRHLKSTWRFDCYAGYIKDLVYMGSLRMTEKDDFYARMVREGQISRDEALARLREENLINLEEIHAVLRQAGISDMSILDDLVKAAEEGMQEMNAEA